MSAENVSADEAARGGEAQELQAEEESAEAMDAETDHGDGVAEPPGASRTTEGQPS